MSIGVTNELTTVGTSQIVDGSVTSAKIASGSVGTSQISSGSATSGQLLQADGLGSAIFATIPSGAVVNISEFTATGVWTKPNGVNAVYVWILGGGVGGTGGGRSTTAGTAVTSQVGAPGGGQNSKIFPASILPSTVTVTIGAGGTGGIGYTGTTQNLFGLYGANGGLTYFGVPGNEFLATGGGREGNVATLITPAYYKSSGSITSLALSSFEQSADANLYSMGGRGAPSATVVSSDTTATILAGALSGRIGYGIFYNVTAGAGYTTIGGNGGNASSGYGTGGGNGSPSISGNGGNGGNGYRGGGGGAGGPVYAAAGVTRTTGSGGNGGDGYALVISW